MNHIRGEHKDGLGLDCIRYGGNSGYQAINLAFLFGAKRIILLGYDMQKTDGKSHWHGDHPGSLRKESALASWVQRFDSLASDLKYYGVEVLNASRETALKCFERVDIDSID